MTTSTTTFSNSFSQSLDRYASLLIEVGLNVQPGQLVQISAEAVHRDFVALLVDKAYQRGARYVNANLIDSRFTRSRLLHSSEEDCSFVPDFLATQYDQLLDSVGANLRLVGSEDPEVFSDLDAKRLNLSQLAVRKKIARFYDEGISHSKVHWTVAAAATPAWGKRVFPHLSAEEAGQALWQAIFSVCRADSADCLKLWEEHNKSLLRRAAQLTEMKIEKLHFTGPGTDLAVYLSERAVFRAGLDISPRDVAFEANIPTEEVFTTPNFHRTEGNVRATRPFLIHGKLVSGLELEFKGGKIINFKAETGGDIFGEYIKSDEGASRLGEVALVGIDSPIFKSGLIFEEILFDENAACHIAVGAAYKWCVEGSESLSEAELLQIGCNESKTHTDMMISSEEVDVTATTFAGQTISLLKGGRWCE